jgi:hypothetical protein
MLNHNPTSYDLLNRCLSIQRDKELYNTISLLTTMSRRVPHEKSVAERHDVPESYRDKMMRDYALVFPNIKKILGGYEVEVPQESSRRKFLKDIDPEMFIPEYQRFCPHQPTILFTPEELEDAKAARKDIMIYPLTEKEGARRAYVCNNKEYPYIGLKVNRLENKSKHPYLPCCFEEPQVEPKHVRYQYENAGEGNERGVGKGRSDPIQSHKIIKPNSYGILPEDVQSFLIALDPGSTPQVRDQPNWLRQGTIRSFNSVLDALINAMFEYYSDLDDEKKPKYRKFMSEQFPLLDKAFDSYVELDPIRKETYLVQIRKALVDLLPSNVAAQSTFNLEMRALKDELSDGRNYLNVRVVWRLLEEVFHINIVLFQRTTDLPKGSLASPMFLQEYLQFKRNKEQTRNRYTVLLFETMGGESDRLEYPQVEIIKNFHSTGSETKENVVFGWFNRTKDRVLLRRLNNAFDKIYGYDGHPNLSIPNMFNSKPVGQCADFYGKIRLLQFSNNLCIVTDPLPPMDRSNLEEKYKTKCELVPVPNKDARAFLQLEGIEEGSGYKRVVVDGKVVGYDCWKSTKVEGKELIHFYLPIEPFTAPKAEVGTPALGPSFISKESLMESFNKLARLARYLVEYVLWIFSFWHVEKKGELQSAEYIVQFAKERFLVEPKHEYPARIPRMFNRSLGGVISGGKIVVPNIETRNRLIYGLRIRISQDAEEITDYHTRIYIKDYYRDVTDFEVQTTNVILFGTDMILSWIQSQLPHYILHDRVQFGPCADQPSQSEEEQKAVAEAKQENDVKVCRELEEEGFVIDPYFMRLDNLDNSIYLVQHAKNTPHALYIGQTWLQQGFNAGYASDGFLSTTIPFRYIAYNGPFDFTVDIINSEKNGSEIPLIIVLQYKFKDRIYTMSLLRFTGAS